MFTCYNSQKVIYTDKIIQEITQQLLPNLVPASVFVFFIQ